MSPLSALSISLDSTFNAMNSHYLLALKVFSPVCYYKTRIKISVYSLKCASRIVRNLSNCTGQKSAKFAEGRKSGKYI
jgi:hypothetical protein